MFFKKTNEDWLIKVTLDLQKYKFDEISSDDIMLFLKNFWEEVKSDFHIKLMMCGGVKSYFKDLKQLLIKMYFIDWIAKISIYTNDGTLPNVIFSDKLNIYFSINELKNKDYKKLLKNVLLCNKKCKTFVILNKFDKNNAQFLRKLKDNNFSAIKDLSNEKYLLNNESFTLKEIKNKISFKGWNCLMNSFMLDDSLNLRTACYSNLGNIFDLTTYKKIKLNIICNKKICKNGLCIPKHFIN